MKSIGPPTLVRTTGQRVRPWGKMVKTRTESPNRHHRLFSTPYACPFNDLCYKCCITLKKHPFTGPAHLSRAHRKWANGSNMSQYLWTNVPHGTVGIYVLNYLKMWSILVFFLPFSKNGLFLCLFIIMFCLISRKRQKLRNRPKRTFFSIHQYLSNGTKTKPLAPTFFSYDWRPVDMSQQNAAQGGPMWAGQFLMMQTG